MSQGTRTTRLARTPGHRVKIVVDPEFAALIPPLAADEQAQLERELLADGCRDALLVWKRDKGPTSSSTATTGWPCAKDISSPLTLNS
jgi:hypothetical protein